MKLGVIYPQIELDPDPMVLRDYAQAVEGMGYQDIAVYDHVLGADMTHRDPKDYNYTTDNQFHEPFVMLGYLAGLTRSISLTTCVLVLPQRQTALVAKQAAEVDVLSGGRLRLGVGVGWNAVEYEALNKDFSNRGKRILEQIDVLRALWIQEVVTFHGEWHHIQEAGINPLPVQRPIPVWMGGGAEAVLRRVGSHADGWIPFSRSAASVQNAKAGLERIKIYAAEVGRHAGLLGTEGRVWVNSGGPDAWRERYETFRDMGFTNVSINTMEAGYTTLDQHLAALRRFRETVA